MECASEALQMPGVDFLVARESGQNNECRPGIITLAVVSKSQIQALVGARLLFLIPLATYVRSSHRNARRCFFVMVEFKSHMLAVQVHGRDHGQGGQGVQGHSSSLPSPLP